MSIRNAPYWFILQSAGSIRIVPISIVSRVRGLYLWVSSAELPGLGVSWVSLISFAFAFSSALRAVRTFDMAALPCPAAMISFCGFPSRSMAAISCCFGVHMMLLMNSALFWWEQFPPLFHLFIEVFEPGFHYKMGCGNCQGS